MSTIQTTPSPSSSADARPRTSWLRFLLAGLLFVAAAATGLLVAGLADTAVTASLEAAASGPSEGFTVTAHPDPYYVYSLDGTPVTAITVTASDGSTLPVTLSEDSFTYGPHRQGLQVGTFEVPIGQGLVDYRVTVTPAQGQGDVRVAVTTFDVTGFNQVALWATLALLAVNVGVALALVVLWAPGKSPSRTPSTA